MQEYRDNLSFAAKADIFKKAKALRATMTESEKWLWEHIRDRKLAGLKFRRQHPLDIFIADFYCHERKLIVELDGGIHDSEDQAEYDLGRTFDLEQKGFKIVRFRNEEVINDVNQVLDRILKESR